MAYRLSPACDKCRKPGYHSGTWDGERRKIMPYITVESGTLSDEQKERLIKKLTDAASEIMEVPREFFSITIKELPDKNFGIGGRTIDKVKAEYMQARKFIPDK